MEELQYIPSNFRWHITYMQAHPQLLTHTNNDKKEFCVVKFRV